MQPVTLAKEFADAVAAQDREIAHGDAERGNKFAKKYIKAAHQLLSLTRGALSTMGRAKSNFLSITFSLCTNSMKTWNIHILLITTFIIGLSTVGVTADKELPKIIGVAVKSEKKNLIPLIDIEKNSLKTLEQRYANFDPTIVPNASFDPNSSKAPASNG